LKICFKTTQDGVPRYTHISNNRSSYHVLEAQRQSRHLSASHPWAPLAAAAARLSNQKVLRHALQPNPEKKLTPTPVSPKPAPMPKSQRKHGSNSRTPSNSNHPESPPSAPSRSRFVPLSRREQERTFAMLWEKPSYRTSSSSPVLKLGEQDKRPGQHRGSQPFMWPNCRGGEGLRTKDADAFKGTTPLEDWLRREERHERFLGEWGRK